MGALKKNIATDQQYTTAHLAYVMAPVASICEIVRNCFKLEGQPSISAGQQIRMLQSSV
jgi:hypothetical protein